MIIRSENENFFQIAVLWALDCTSLALPYLGDFGTSTTWGRGRKCPPSIFSLFFKLCQPNFVRGNNVQKWFKMWKKIVIFFHNDVIMASFPFQISEFPSLSSLCSKSNAQLLQKNNNSLIFMLNRSCLGMLQIIRVKIFFKWIIKDGDMLPQTCTCH